MTALAARDQDQISSSLKRFWSRETQRSAKLKYFMDGLMSIGPVGVFGGMIRDFARSGAREFRSDIDLVVEADSTELAGFLSSYSYRSTKFGGYRLTIDRWLVDVWPLSETWAARAGHVQVTTLRDLTSTTFFNWDAAVYELGTCEPYWADNYLDHLHARHLDINLLPNPNPIGAALRTLQMMRLHDAKISHALTAYLLESISTHFREICKTAESKNLRWISDKSLLSLKSALRTHLEQAHRTSEFRLQPRQMTLFD